MQTYHTKTNYEGIFNISQLILVYAWIRNKKYLYIGSTTVGISRFNNHHVIDINLIEPEDVFEFWFCDNETHVKLLEIKLIRELKPSYNTKNYDAVTRKLALRRSETQRAARYRAELKYKPSAEAFTGVTVEGPTNVRLGSTLGRRRKYPKAAPALPYIIPAPNPPADNS